MAWRTAVSMRWLSYVSPHSGVAKPSVCSLTQYILEQNHVQNVNKKLFKQNQPSFADSVKLALTSGVQTPSASIRWLDHVISHFWCKYAVSLHHSLPWLSFGLIIHGQTTPHPNMDSSISWRPWQHMHGHTLQPPATWPDSPSFIFSEVSINVPRTRCSKWKGPLQRLKPLSRLKRFTITLVYMA